MMLILINQIVLKSSHPDLRRSADFVIQYLQMINLYLRRHLCKKENFRINNLHTNLGFFKISKRRISSFIRV